MLKMMTDAGLATDMKLKLIESTTKKVFHYQADTGEEAPRDIYIKFKDGEFFEVNFDFWGRYTREQWKALAEVEKEISKLEKEIKEGPL